MSRSLLGGGGEIPGSVIAREKALSEFGELQVFQEDCSTCCKGRGQARNQTREIHRSQVMQALIVILRPSKGFILEDCKHRNVTNQCLFFQKKTLLLCISVLCQKIAQPRKGLLLLPGNWNGKTSVEQALQSHSPPVAPTYLLFHGSALLFLIDLTEKC